MQNAFLSFGSSRIFYTCWGTGNNILLCLHGYGESARSFEYLSTHLPTDQYRIIAIDLPFHGQTIWPERRQFTVQDLISVIDGILGALHIEQVRYSILGFSLGGRMVMSLFEKLPGRIIKIFLLAPDGLKVNGWYSLATNTLTGNAVFKLMMNYPGLLFQILKTSRALRLTTQHTYSFTTYYIQDQQARHDLYLRWTVLQKFHPSLGQIKSLINNYKIPVQLIFGEFDQIVRFERGYIFRKGIESFCDIKILPCGHQVLNEKTAGIICQTIRE